MTLAYLIRHAKAKNRLKWSEPDHLRPLTKAGLEQASALPGLYEGQPFSRLFSSPAFVKGRRWSGSLHLSRFLALACLIR